MSFLAKFKHNFRATDINAGWSSLVARQAHNLKVAGSNPAPATNKINDLAAVLGHIFWKNANNAKITPAMFNLCSNAKITPENNG